MLHIAVGVEELLAELVPLRRMVRYQRLFLFWVGLPPTVRRSSMIRQPTVEVHETAQVLLTNSVEAVVDQLLRRLEQEARSRSVALRGIEVYGFSDPEDDSRELVVRELVDLNEQSALDYWEEVSLAIEAWAATLPADVSKIVRTQIAIEVVWHHGG
jgi:hypothetical protein